MVQNRHPVRTIGDVDVLVISRADALQLLISRLATGTTGNFGFCNAHTVNMAASSPIFAGSLRQHILFQDGIGLDIASRLLYGARFPENLNGTDFTPAVLRACPKPLRLFLLGSPPGVAQTAAHQIERTYPGVEVVGTRDGFFGDDEGQRVADQIRDAKANLVLVGMGHPRQEQWAARYGQHTGAVCLSVGAFLDFTAGRVSRAPLWVREARAEWIYRLMLEPRRLASRYLLGNGRFLLAILRQKKRMAG